MAQQTLELEEEFKNILKKIHPYFKALKSTNNDTSLCQKWLHKLFKTDEHEMKLRNAYTSELLKQLKNGKLNEPFTKPPKTKGLLLPLPIQTNMSTQNFYIDTKTTTNKKLYNSVWDVLNCQNITDVDRKYTGNYVHSNGYNTEEIDEKDELNYKQISDFIDTSKNSEELQRRKPTADKSEGGDGCVLDRETEIKLESFEKTSEELQMKHELLVNRLHAVELQADENASNTNHIAAAIMAELTKVRHGLDAMSDREAIKGSDDAKMFNALTENSARLDRHVERFVAEARGLRGLMEDACDRKRIVADMMASVERLTELGRAQLAGKNSRIDERLDAFEDAVDELQARVDLDRSSCSGRCAAAAVAGAPGDYDGDDDGGDDDDDNRTMISQ